MHSEYRQDIQSLRGLFVVFVVLFHFFPGAFPNGYLGVDGFFTVSGYVLAPQLLKIFSSPNPMLAYKIFLKRRFWRLYPAFLVSIALCLGVLFFFVGPAVHERSFMQILYSLVNLGDVGAFKFSGNYFDPSPNPFVHFWSLSVEWQFYLAFPLTIVLLMRLSADFREVRILGFVIIVTVLSLIVWILQDGIERLVVTLGLSDYSSGLGYYLGIGRFWQFLGGFLSFILLQNRRHFSKQSLNFLAYILLLGLLFQGFFNDVSSSIGISLLTALILGRSPEENHFFSFLRINKFLLFIGNISYSVYLIHFPFAVALRQNLLLFNYSSIGEVIIKILVCASIVLLSYFIFNKVENPYRDPDLLAQSISIRKTYSLLVLFCLTLGTFYLGISGSYFGLMGSNEKPPYETYIGENCRGNSPNALVCEGNSDGVTGSVALLGDSHAEHLSNTFFARATDLDFKYFGIGFCAPALEQYLDMRPGCLEFSLKAKAQIERIRPNILVISVLISNEEMLRAVLKYIKSLQGTAGEIIVLTNSPYFREPIFPDRPLIHGVHAYPKGSSLNNMNLHFQTLSEDFAHQLGKLGIETYDLWSLFCNSTYCSRFDEGNWLYIDQHHFSSFGANRLGPVFLDLLGKFDSNESNQARQD